MIVYEDTDIKAMKTILRQIQVIGDEQATLLAMLGQGIRSGKPLEEPEAFPKPVKRRQRRKAVDHQKEVEKPVEEGK